MADAPITLQDAIEHLYQTAHRPKGKQSTLRLRQLALYCVEQLEMRGLRGAETEVTISGGNRPKQWDVAWKAFGKYRLVVSLKSILTNLPGTVPNRTDDLIGEVANVQMYSPEIVVGYIMVFNVAKDAVSLKHSGTWCNLITSRLSRLSGRSAPSWSIGMIESFAVVQVDFSQGPRLITPEREVHAMLDALVAEVKNRNPLLAEGSPPA